MACLDPKCIADVAERIATARREGYVEGYDAGVAATMKEYGIQPADAPRDEPCKCGAVRLDRITGTYSKLTKENGRYISTDHRRDRCEREDVSPPADAHAECPRCLAFRNGTARDVAAKLDHSPGCAAHAGTTKGEP